MNEEIKYYYHAPTYLIDTNEWTTTPFQSRRHCTLYIDSMVKYPGEYNLKHTEGIWNKQAKHWETNKSYPSYMKGSLDFRKHWDAEKDRCKFDGFIIYKSEKDNTEFAVPCLYYFYLNYCPIVDKIKAKLGPPEIYDGDYHYFLYILRCILHRKYGVVLKKRQAGYTLKNMAILLNVIWFGDAATSKIFASDISKVNDSWNLMTNYKDHINKYCGWKRGFEPEKLLDWQVRRKMQDGSIKGNLSIAKGFTTKQDPTNGIGGNATIIFGEEAGQNPTLDESHEFITSNVALGGLVTGLIIYSGAVGQLDKADPLKEFIMHPEEYDFLSCPNNIEDDIEFGSRVGFFAPEWWNYVSVDEELNSPTEGNVLRCYDQYGNTNKKLAMSEITRHREKAKRKKASSYRYYCSQRPLSIKEAFAFRKDAYFPQDIVGNQLNRLDIEKPSLKEVVLFEDPKSGKIRWRMRKDDEPEAITKFPLGEKDDKRGCVVFAEIPPDNPERFTYFAGVDDIMTDVTTTSESLFTVTIFKNIKEVKYEDENGIIKTRVEGNEPVAWYTGRMGDLKETHKIGEYLIRIFNAFAACENNVSNFINHMQSKGLQYLLAAKADIPFIKELDANKETNRGYGVYMSPTIKNYLLANAKEYITEVLDIVRDSTGDVKYTQYGVTKIKDRGLLHEFYKFHVGLNVDRLISFMLAQSMAKTYQVAGIINREDLTVKKELPKYVQPTRSYFKLMDVASKTVKPRKYFKYM